MQNEQTVANPQPGAPEDAVVRGFISEALDHGRYFIQCCWLDPSKPPSARLQSRITWHDFPPGDLPTALRLAREKVSRELRGRDEPEAIDQEAAGRAKVAAEMNHETPRGPQPEGME